MKIEKAIEVLKTELDGVLINYPRELDQALKLGIEALKRVQLQGDPDGCKTPALLPRETED